MTTKATQTIEEMKVLLKASNDELERINKLMIDIDKIIEKSRKLNDNDGRK